MLACRLVVRAVARPLARALSGAKAPKPALHAACETGDAAAVKKLLSEGHDAAAPDGMGTPPLHVAVRLGHDDVVTTLLAHGASASAPAANTWAYTPLQYAAIFGQKSVASTLLAAPGIELLAKELMAPLFGEYHLFFSNVVPSYFLQQLADADTHEIIRQVQEFYADFMAINDDLFTINQRNAIRLSNSFDDNEMFLRNVQGVLSVLLALKKRPLIRYNGRSELAMRLAERILRDRPTCHISCRSRKAARVLCWLPYRTTA